MGESIWTERARGSESAYSSAVGVEHKSTASPARSHHSKATAARGGYGGAMGIEYQSPAGAAGNKFSSSSPAWVRHGSSVGKKWCEYRRPGSQMRDSLMRGRHRQVENHRPH